jgi:hypothetical protein
LSEIWSTNIEFYHNILPEYRFHYQLSHVSYVGGIGMFVKSTCNCQELPEMSLTTDSCDRLENIWIELTKNSKKYIIGGIYRHPNQKLERFTAQMDLTLGKLANLKCPCIIAGDINIDLVKCNSCRGTADYVDTLITNNFIPTVILPTRITPQTATLVDHIYYHHTKNTEHFVVKAGNFTTDISDHLPNYLLVINSKKQDVTTRPMIRSYSDKNRHAFVSEIQHKDWASIFSANDVNAAYNEFIFTLQDAFRRNFPFQKMSRKRMKDKKWITKGLKKCSRVKNKLYKEWISTRDAVDELKYKSYKKIFKKVSLEAESLYYKQLFDIKTNSIKRLWSNLNMVCNFKMNKSKSTIYKLRTNSEIVTDKNDICNVFNQYFVNIGDKLVTDVLSQYPSWSANDCDRYLNKPLAHSIFCEPVTAPELSRLITNLNTSKSAGADNLSPKLIKDIAPAILEPLLYIFNFSLTSGAVPAAMKLAKVIPVLKKGDPQLPGNCRPISLLSIFDKLLEKIMYARLFSFLSDNKVLYDYQFGFRKNYSTGLALLEVTDSIYQSLDNGDICCGIYLDLQKAFALIFDSGFHWHHCTRIIDIPPYPRTNILR